MASRFEMDLKRFAQRVRSDHVDAINNIGLDLTGRVVRKNPVDTGLSRSRWVFTRAEPSNPVALLQNNTSYILELERGHSRQAPNGFVAISIAEISEIYR